MAVEVVEGAQQRRGLGLGAGVLGAFGLQPPLELVGDRLGDRGHEREQAIVRVQRDAVGVGQERQLLDVVAGFLEVAWAAELARAQLLAIR